MSDKPFADSNGIELKVGDTIKITRHTFPHLCNIPAKLLWDAENGMMNFTFTETRRKKQFTTTEDFYGVWSFEKIEQ